ncbi:hypothetical protein ZWY2020_007188 [Hordeum vulgare]|nr:hypothetical protein ZWY2020_007188 [Hordeum vulgare]
MRRFPSAELLRVWSHDFIRCPINKILISAHAATAEPEPVPPLEKVWVLVYGLPRGGSAAPRGGKLTHFLKTSSEPGRLLTFELESPAVVGLHGSAPNATVPGDDGRDEDGGSSEESSFCEEDDGDGGVPPAAFDGRRTPVFTATGPSGTAGMAFGTGSVVLTGPSPVVTTLLALDIVEILGGSSPVVTSGADLEFTEADVLSVGMEVCPSSLSCSPGVVCYSRSPGSPSPALGSPDLVPPPTLDLVVSAMTPEAAGSEASGEASPVVSAWQSARLIQSCLLLDGRVPIIEEKATLRAAARDLSPEVATDSGIVFRGEKGPILEQIFAICAKEKLRGHWRKPVPMLRVVNPAPRGPLTLVIERPGVVRPSHW